MKFQFIPSIFVGIFLGLCSYNSAAYAENKALELTINQAINSLPLPLKNYYLAVAPSPIRKEKFREVFGRLRRCIKVEKISYLNEEEFNNRSLRFFVDPECTPEQLRLAAYRDLVRGYHYLFFNSQPRSLKIKAIENAYLSGKLTQSPVLVLNMQQKLEDVVIDYLAESQMDGRIAQAPNQVNMARVKILYTTQEAWSYRLKLLDEATKSIRIQTYIFYDDIFTQSMTAVLLKALENGVKVQIMVDAKGSLSTKNGRLLTLLHKRGADVRVSNPVVPNLFNIFKFFKLGLLNTVVATNHDKIILVDDHKLIAGGRNLGAKYFLEPNESLYPSFQDLDIYLETVSPNREAILAFNSEFYSSHGIRLNSPFFNEREVLETSIRSLKTIISYMRDLPQKFPILKEHQVKSLDSLKQLKNFKFALSESYYPVQGIDKTSIHGGVDILTPSLYQEILGAKKSIRLVSPYMIITENLEQVFERVYRNNPNIDIEIMTVTALTTSSILTHAYFLKDWKRFLKKFPRMKIYGYTGPYHLHAKFFLIDDVVSYIGSFNLDYLSENRNSEFKVRIYGGNVNRELKNFIQTNLKSQSILFDADRNIGPLSVGNRDQLKKFLRFQFLAGVLRGIL